ncbi:MAG: peptide ABC transporter substrate-binding protein [Verrucomicrobium sp.]|nr:peptide ABC transporter substrate-binding protein [Verrucomicrobium sp.]
MRVLPVLFCLLLGGCGRALPPADFTFINGAEPETLDPHVVTGQPEIRLCEALFEGLTSRDGRGAIIPGIAEKWDVSADGRVYTFHLRAARWSNGDPLTSADFLNSWRRALEPLTASEYAYQYYPIVNAQAYNTGALSDFAEVGVKAPDPQTLRVTLSAPTPYFLDLCACSTLAPIHLGAMKQWGEDWIKPGKLVTDGPYTLGAWRINDRITLVKNPHYWRARDVAFRRIDALSLSSATTAFNLFHSGEAGLILDKSMVPAFFIDALRSKSYFHSQPIYGTYFYRFNVTRKPLKDPRVRLALALAVDRKRLVDRITRAGEPPAGTFVPPGIGGYTPPEGMSYDPARARKLLAAAGFPGGKGFPVLSVLYNSSEQNEQIATEIQDMWRENLGISIELRNQEWKVYLNSLSELDYDIARSSWVADYPDPNTFLDCFMSGRGNNRTGWSSARYDGLIEEACRQPDRAARYALFRQAEEILSQEAPIAPLYNYVAISIYRPDHLGGFFPNAMDEHPLRELFWREPAP